MFVELDPTRLKIHSASDLQILEGTLIFRKILYIL